MAENLTSETRKRNDSQGTEFGEWTRDNEECPELNSYLGFRAYNIDYGWWYRPNGKWIMIEEKRFKSILSDHQKEFFRIVDRACRNDPNYLGFALLQFERKSPKDGKIFLTGREITKKELIEFLKLTGKGRTKDYMFYEDYC